MKRILLLILVFFMTSTNCLSLEIVYPKKNPSVINATSTFFIGATNPTDRLKINETEVKINKMGAFAQLVPLSVGKNEFQITSTTKDQNKTTVIFVIEKPTPSVKNCTISSLIEYPPMSDFYVQTEGTPLRTTPIDGGINRMSHLPKGMQLTVNGEKNGFYRVFLNSKTFGWIDKSNIENINQTNSTTNCPVNLRHAKCRLTKEFYVYEFEFEKRVPFTITEESSGLDLEFFNVKSCDDNTLAMNIPIQKLVGYDGWWQNEKFILKVRKPLIIDCKKPLKNITIAVDAGHGGGEAGAIGCCGDKEKDINLAIAKCLQEELNKRGAKVVMTREQDIDVSLSDRVKFAKDHNATLMLSIHANALPDGADPLKNKGTSVYYYHNQAKPLAESILNSMTTELCIQNDKVRQGSLALVRPTDPVSVLIEVAYMINPDDYALLTDKDFQAKCAKAIADGIENYLLK